jgi:hypothetical protein
LTNEDVMDLFGRVKVGTRVVVLPQTAHRAPVARAPTVAPVSMAPSAAPVSVSLRSDRGFGFGIR